MAQFETLSGRFVRDVVMKASNADIMNSMQRCILTLYTYDSRPEDISAENVLRQSIELIAKLPLIAVYSYHSYRHFRRMRLYLSGIHRRDFPLQKIFF